MTLRQAASRLGVSVDTVRRRMQRGELQGRRDQTATGPTWFVELPDDAPTRARDAPRTAETPSAEVVAFQSHIETLRAQLDARTREVSELHVLLQQMQRALPSPPGAGTQDAGGDAGGGAGGIAEGSAGGRPRAPWRACWRRGP